MKIKFCNQKIEYKNKNKKFRKIVFNFILTSFFLGPGLFKIFWPTVPWKSGFKRADSHICCLLNGCPSLSRNTSWELTPPDSKAKRTAFENRDESG